MFYVSQCECVCVCEGVGVPQGVLVAKKQHKSQQEKIIVGWRSTYTLVHPQTRILYVYM